MKSNIENTRIEYLFSLKNCRDMRFHNAYAEIVKFNKNKFYSKQNTFIPF